MRTSDDLRIVASRAEEAVLTEGRPLDDLTVPAPLAPRAVVKAARSWLRAPTGVAPFDGVPDPTTAAWWATHEITRLPVEDGEVIGWERWAEIAAPGRSADRPRHLSAQERLARADAAATDRPTALPVDRPGNHWGRLEPPLDLGARIGVLGTGRALAGVLDVETALTGGLLARDVLSLRAYGLPGVTPEVRERMLAVVADAGAEPRTRLTLSALVARPADHHELVLELGTEPYLWIGTGGATRNVQVGDPYLLVAVGAALPGPQQRRELWFAVDDAVRAPGTSRPLAATFRITDLAVVVYGEPLVDHFVDGFRERRWVAKAVVPLAATLLRRLAGPGAVPRVLQVAVNDTRTVGVVQDWLVEHRDEVAAFDGSLNAARAERLVEALPHLVEAGQTAFAHPVAAAAAAALVARATAGVFGDDGLPPWWTAAVEAESGAGAGPRLARTLPDWVLATPLDVGGLRLAPAEAEAVLRAAAQTVENGPRRPLVAALVDHMTPAERDAAGMHLLNGWIVAGERTQDKPFARAGAVLGADGWVAGAMEQVRAWNEGRYNRAKLGLQLVTLNASPAAAAALAGALTWKKGGMGRVAGIQLAVLADLLGLTADELDLRLVATGDLDARSTRVLDYGPRSFRASLRVDGKVVVHLLDADGRPTGKPRAALPAANSADDPLRVAAAKKALTGLRKTVAGVAGAQAVRLEAALVDGRAWTAADHTTYVAPHPILNPLLRALVWRVDDPDGGSTLVRLDEGGVYVTVDEDTHDLPAGATLSLPHPVRMDPEDREAWRSHLADHDLVPPFAQLDRLDHGGATDEDGAPVLPTGSLHPGSLHGTLAGHGWGPGSSDDGLATVYGREFPGAGLVATVQVTGVLVYSPASSGDQHVRAVDVRRGDGVVVPWADVDPVVAAEVHRAVAALVAKAV